MPHDSLAERAVPGLQASLDDLAPWLARIRLSVLAAAVRAGKIRPTEALREAAVEPKRIGRIRLLAGLIALCCGVGGARRRSADHPVRRDKPEAEAEIVILLVGGTCTSRKAGATIPPPPKRSPRTASIRTETDIHGTRPSLGVNSAEASGREVEFPESATLSH